MAPAPPATLFDKIGVLGIGVQTVLVALSHFLTTPIRSGPRQKSLYKDVLFTAVRFQLGSLSLSQEKYLNPSTEANYLALAKKSAFQPESLTLKSGCQAYWHGDKKADKLIVYFHGGGYVMPCSLAHHTWLHELTSDLSKSFSVATILLGYSCSPEAQYPTQLSQAAELLHHLLTVEGRKPSDIIIAGDSAGGNLATALLSHLLHPHPSVATKIELSEPLKSAILISPWVNFDVNQSSFDRNVQTDMINKDAGSRWAAAFMGDAKIDNYNQPALADAEWFSNLGSVVEDVLVWGGGGEVLISSIQDLGAKLKAALPRSELVVEPGACHEEFIIEKLIGYKEKGQGTKLVEQWISSRL